MVTPSATRSKILELISELRAQRRLVEKEFQAKLGEIDQDLDAVQRTLHLLDGESKSRETIVQQLELEEPEIAPVTQASSIPEALKVIAQLNGGIMNVTKSADLLIKTGKSRSKRRNLIGSVYNIVKNRDSEWEYVRPGMFRLKEASGDS